MRPDASRGWVEQGTQLRFFRVDANPPTVDAGTPLAEWQELTAQDARKLIDALWGATIRSKGTADGVDLGGLSHVERSLSDHLRRPSEIDRQNGHRNAVASIFLGILDRE